MQELARRVAEAQIDVRRVRHARHQLLSQPLSSRAERGLFRRLQDAAPDVSIAGPVEYVTSTMPEGLHKLATVLLEKVRQLSVMDRYERRALSRRKFATRAFDLARWRSRYDCI